MPDPRDGFGRSCGSPRKRVRAREHEGLLLHVESTLTKRFIEPAAIDAAHERAETIKDSVMTPADAASAAARTRSLVRVASLACREFKQP